MLLVTSKLWKNNINTHVYKSGVKVWYSVSYKIFRVVYILLCVLSISCINGLIDRRHIWIKCYYKKINIFYSIRKYNFTTYLRFFVKTIIPPTELDAKTQCIDCAL